MNRTRWAAAGGALAFVVFSLVVLNGVLARTTDTSTTTTERAIFEVQRGPLTISINVSGTIKAREQEVIKCEVEGQTQILSIVEEGKNVKKGELLIELDASSLVDLRVDQEIRVQNAEASYISAREQLEVAKNQAASDVDKAKLTLQFAEEDLKNFVDGEFPKQLKEAEARITLAKGAAARAEEQLAGSEKLAKEDFITPIELEADRQDLVKAKLDLELAEDQKRLLTDFTYKRTMAQLESDVRQAGMALERTERKAAADVVQSEADLKAKESEYLRQKDKLDKIVTQIEKTKIYAPADGLVVYATSVRGSWRGSTEPLEEGQVVRERQELIYLPTGSSFMAEVDVHEASLTKIKPGLPVRITTETAPDKTYQGRIASVAPLPDAQSVWLNPDLKV
ncbi:MAG: HlyD family efflux transporter periplasmic adaptor subunit, partial [Candidatus Hydrogenedentes bacterium]|nr:HlyD family efflux transporter periplasmic adaptor subunit [Candidatus Hydrogenedentota bacterium]